MCHGREDMDFSSVAAQELLSADLWFQQLYPQASVVHCNSWDKSGFSSILCPKEGGKD